MGEHYPEILRRYMGEERDGGFEYTDKTTKEASNICGASQSASDAAKGTEPLGRQERAQYSGQVRPLEEIALKEWAFKESLWLSEKDFRFKYRSRYIGEGAEQKVY